MRGNRGIVIGRIFVLTSAAHYLLSCADYNQFKQQAELKKKKKIRTGKWKTNFSKILLIFKVSLNLTVFSLTFSLFLNKTKTISIA